MEVNVLEAKTKLSSLIKKIEIGKEKQIIITKYGKPVVKMSIYNDVPVSKRIGVAKGKLKTPGNLYWMFFQYIWVNIIPMRHLMLRVYTAIRRVRRIINHL